MIRVKNYETNRDILILWKHKIPKIDTSTKFSGTKSRRKEELNGSTTCFICDDNKESIIIEQVALKSKDDQFSRKIGRNVSFRKAMNYIRDNEIFNKEIRSEIWNKFFETGGLKVNI